MLCEYLRHIDLLAVYEQMPSFQMQDASPLGNIPQPLCETLAAYFVELAEIATEDEHGIEWHRLAPLDVAVAVGDFIESELEHLTCGTTWPALFAEEQLDPGKALQTFLSFASEANTNSGTDYPAMACLLIYQYDALCSLYASGHHESSLEVFESIAETRESLAHCLELGGRQLQRSHEARTVAAARHREGNEQRAVALADWEAEGHKFSSMRAFARECFKRYGVTDFMTVYNWLRRARKELEEDQS